ncbi:hypothetical protein ACJX0J_006549, partial [Zea mays]
DKKTRGYVPWNDEMDKVLLDTFVDYYNKGDRCQNGNKEAKGYRHKVAYDAAKEISLIFWKIEKLVLYSIVKIHTGSTTHRTRFLKEKLYVLRGTGHEPKLRTTLLEITYCIEFSIVINIWKLILQNHLMHNTITFAQAKPGQ